MTSDNRELLIDFFTKFYDPFDANRQVGRSQILAEAFIKIAIKYPNEWIIPVDHLDGKRHVENMVRKIQLLVNPDSFEFQIHKFRFVLSASMMDRNNM